MERKKEREGRKEDKIELNRSSTWLSNPGEFPHDNHDISSAKITRERVIIDFRAPLSASNACAGNTTSPVIDTLAIYPPPIFLSVPTPLPIRYPFRHRQCLLLLPAIDRFVANRLQNSKKKGKGGKREILETPEIQEYRKRSNNNINSSSSSWIGSTLAETSDRGEGGACIDRRVVMRRAACAPLRGVEARAEGGGTRIEARVSLVADDASFVAAVERNQPRGRDRCSLVPVEGSRQRSTWPRAGKRWAASFSLSRFFSPFPRPPPRSSPPTANRDRWRSATRWSRARITS